MKKFGSTVVCITLTSVLFIMACHKSGSAGSGNGGSKLLQGEWKLKTGDTKLKITGKKFAMDSDLKYAEDYFVKDDTIFTSFEGNQPYTKFVVQKLDDHDLKILSPDSTVMEFTR